MTCSSIMGIILPALAGTFIQAPLKIRQNQSAVTMWWVRWSIPTSHHVSASLLWTLLKPVPVIHQRRVVDQVQSFTHLSELYWRHFQVYRSELDIDATKTILKIRDKTTFKTCINWILSSLRTARASMTLVPFGQEEAEPFHQVSACFFHLVPDRGAVPSPAKKLWTEVGELIYPPP